MGFAVVESYPEHDFNSLCEAYVSDNPKGIADEITTAIATAGNPRLRMFTPEDVGGYSASISKMASTLVFMTAAEFRDDPEFGARCATQGRPLSLTEVKGLRTVKVVSEDSVSSLSGVAFKITQLEQLHLLFKYRQLSVEGIIGVPSLLN